MKFRSSILKLPPNIRTELDSFIEDGSKSGLAIYHALKEKYGSVTQVPTVPTILRYVKYYNIQKNSMSKRIVEEKITYKFEDGIKEIENVLIQIDNGQEPRFNKLRVLEGLAAKCLMRIKDIEDKHKDTISAEGAIAKYISEAKNIIESINKLSKDVSNDEQVLIQLIRNESRGVLEAVRDIILDIAPDKYELFKEKLKHKMSDHGAVIDIVSSAKPEEDQKLLETEDGDIHAVDDTMDMTTESIPELENVEQLEEDDITNV